MPTPPPDDDEPGQGGSALLTPADDAAGVAATGRLTLIYLLGSIAAAAITFLSVPLFTRALGVAVYGELSLVLTIGMAAAAVLAFGSDVVLARFWFDEPALAARKERARQWITFLFLWSTVLSILFASLALLLGDRLGYGLGVLLAIGLLGTVPQLMAQMLAQVLRNQFQAWRFALTGILNMLLRAALGLAAIGLMENGAAAVLIGWILADVVVVLLRLRMVRIDWRGSFRYSELAPLIRFGLPIIPGTLAAWAYVGVDRIILAGIDSVSAVGAYAAAAALAGAFLVLRAAIGQAWLPALSAEFAQSPHRARGMIRTWGEVALAVAGAAAMVLSGWSHEAIRIFAGEDFEAAAAALPLLAVGQAFNLVAMFAASGSTLAKRSRLIPVIALAGVLVEVVLLLLLIPPLGVAGAALGVAVGYLVMAIGFALYSQATFPIRIPVPALVAEVSLLLLVAALATWGPQGAWTKSVCILSAFVLLFRGAFLALRSRRDQSKGGGQG